MSWIDEVLTTVEEAETPRSYIWWSMISAIAAVVGPNVYLNRQGIYRLSPNVYIMLIGDSGLGKGLPIAIAKKLVRLANSTRVITGRNTIQAIIKELATTATEPGMEAPKFKDSRGFIVSGEFATLMQKDPDSLTILTDLYDVHWNEDWTNTLKSSPIEKLVKPNITLLGGSSPEHFSEAVPEVNIRGGFIGRTLMIYEEDRYKVNPLENEDVNDELPFEQLAIHLRELGKLKGPFKQTPEARKYWVEWYNATRPKKVVDITGTANRLPDHVLKTAMCISLSKDIELILRREDIEEAVERVMGLSLNTNRIVSGKGKSQLGHATKIVLEHLIKADDHTIARAKLLERGYGEYDAFELDRIIATLEGGELITTRQVDGKPYYTLSESAINKLKTLFTS